MADPVGKWSDFENLASLDFHAARATAKRVFYPLVNRRPRAISKVRAEVHMRGVLETMHAIDYLADTLLREPPSSITVIAVGR
jgi:hypothetical protein